MSKDAENLELWNRFADIDPKHTKQISGKSYRGTSPNAQYVIRCLTEMFGPVGKGFGWEVLHEEFQPLGDQILHWCRIRFWYGDNCSFESYGQTFALMKTKNGPRADDDAPKKSLTDAITKAASHVGIGANIYMGRWDDNRYVAEVDAKFREEEGEPTPAEHRTAIKTAIQNARNILDLQKVWKANAGIIQALPQPMRNELTKAKDDKKAQWSAVTNDPANQAPQQDHRYG